VQNAKGLMRAVVNGHSGRQVRFGNLQKFDAEVFYDGALMSCFQVLDVEGGVHNALIFSYFCGQIRVRFTYHQSILAKKELYIIRHGETDYNRRGIVQGSGVDAPLNEMGQSQAFAFFQAYQHVPFAKIYMSTLQRTYQTVEPFLELGIPYEKLSGLNEISWGIMEGKVPSSLDDAYYRNLIENWAAGNTALTTEQGESPNDVVARQRPAMAHILAQPSESPVLIAMHGRAMRILMSWLLDQPLARMDQFEHSNLCLYKLTYNTIAGTFHLDVANDTAHLLAVGVY
jgi:broad specificity phosphatase PhoE